MGAFQIVYDDFSGGQYMGPKSTNQPKNTWHGNNIICNARGELVPTGTLLAARNSVTESGGLIIDHWIMGDFGYVFVAYAATAKMLRYTHNNGSAFPVNTTNSTLPTPNIIGNSVAYSSITNSFYWPYQITGSSSGFYKTTTSGSSSLMSGTVDRQITGIASYKLRLLSWGGSRLFYSGNWSGTDFGAWSSAQYYEFDSRIQNVFPRTDDVLVVCDQGVYSLTGVLGSGVNIQLLIPGPNVSDGMQYGDVVNRSLYYLDNSGVSLAGPLDGRLYRMSGASTTAVASFDLNDVGFNPNGTSTLEPGRVIALPNGRISVLFKNGVSYNETTPGVFSKSDIHNIDTGTFAARYKQAKAGPGAPNEYMVTAVIDTSLAGKIAIYRTLNNVPSPTFLDAEFSISASTRTVLPTGTVELPEYWHSKPFTVKEMFIEYSVATGGSIAASITPTGVVDVGPTELASSGSSTTTDSTQTAGGFRMYRYWPNNSSKGFGIKPNMTLTNCTVKRVIVNCED